MGSKSSHDAQATERCTNLPMERLPTNANRQRQDLGLSAKCSAENQRPGRGCRRPQAALRCMDHVSQLGGCRQLVSRSIPSTFCPHTLHHKSRQRAHQRRENPRGAGSRPLRFRFRAHAIYRDRFWRGPLSAAYRRRGDGLSVRGLQGQGHAPRSTPACQRIHHRPSPHRRKHCSCARPALTRAVQPCHHYC